jgi:hypothetical protein
MAYIKLTDANLSRKAQRVAKHSTFCKTCGRATFKSARCFRCIKTPDDESPAFIEAMKKQIRLENMIRDAMMDESAVTDENR